METKASQPSLKPVTDVVFKSKSKHKSILAFLHREKPALRRSPRLQNKENESNLINHTELQDVKSKAKISKKEKKKPHRPVIKQRAKSADLQGQKSLKRMRSASISFHGLDTIKPAKRAVREEDTNGTKLVNDENVADSRLKRRSLRSSIGKVINRYSPKVVYDIRDTLNHTHCGDFARPMVSPAHTFVRQGSKKYKQLPTPIRRRPSKLWIDTCARAMNNIWGVLTPSQIQRQEAIFELYTGEDDMFEDLRLLREAYYNPMSMLGLIEEQDLQQLFGFIEILLPLHEDLSMKLKSLKNEKDMVDEVGSVLLEWVSTVRPYINYCAGQVLARDVLEKVLKEDNGVADFLQRCRESPFSRKLELWSFIDAPRGRLVKYPLLFNTILKLTPKEHSDRILLKRAICEMERIIAEADSETGRCKCEHMRKKFYFLDPQHATLVNQASSLFCDGVLRNKNGTKLHVFLFDNIFVMSRPATRQGQTMFQISCPPVDIASLTLEDVPDGEVRIGGSFKNTLTKNQFTDKHLFRICVNSSTQQKFMTFQANDDHDKKQWIKNFQCVLNRRLEDRVKTKICFESVS